MRLDDLGARPQKEDAVIVKLTYARTNALHFFSRPRDPVAVKDERIAPKVVDYLVQVGAVRYWRCGGGIGVYKITSRGHRVLNQWNAIEDQFENAPWKTEITV